MGRRALKSDDVEGFVMAFWDEVRDTEMLYQVNIVLDLRRKAARGGISFHAIAVRVDEEGQERPAGTAQVDWPSAKFTSLHACLYRLSMAIAVTVQKEYQERTGEWYVGAPLNLGKKD